MPSRDPLDLHPELAKRWRYMARVWRQRFPAAPQPFLTATYRPPHEQWELVNAGRSNAKPGQSLHGFQPALAFDVAFDPDASDGIGNDLTWTFRWFEKWGELAEEIGLEWGGRWPNLVDGPHVQWPVTWQQAKSGQLPPLPPLATDVSDLIPAATLHLRRSDGTFDVIELDRNRPARLVGDKLYANEPQ